MDKEARCARPGFLASLGMPGALARGAVLPSPDRPEESLAQARARVKPDREKGGGWRQPPL